MICPHCETPVFRRSDDGKLKARTSILVIAKSGDAIAVETNCASCGHGIVLPLALAQGPFEIKKSANPPRFVARRT